MTANLLRWTSLATLAALAALALPAASEWYEGKPACPPDTACTMSEPGGAEPAAPRGDAPPCDGCVTNHHDTDRGNASDEPRYGPCGGEACPTDEPGRPVGNGTCMDGSAPGEACDDDVQYLGPGNDAGSGGGDARGPAPPGAHDKTAGPLPRPVPTLGLLALFGALAVAATTALPPRG